MPEKLTTNAKRLRPFILGYMEDVVASNVVNADILGELNKIIYQYESQNPNVEYRKRFTRLRRRQRQPGNFE